MAELISLRLSNELKRAVENLSKEEAKERSELIRELLIAGIKEKKLEKAIALYKNGKATLWKASRVAGISLWKMTEVLRERKVEAQYGVRELKEDLKALL
ncbi:MAG: UPF0175 family protein [Candidatus Thermoplasmatota archaeon]